MPRGLDMFAWIKEMAITDRREAGRRLAAWLDHLRAESPVVVGVSAGGTVVAAEIARQLNAPLDVMVVKSVRAPNPTGDVVGAVALGEVAFFEPLYVTHHRLTIADLQTLTTKATAEIKRRTRRLRGRASLPPVQGRTVILVNDGIASRAALLAGLWALRDVGARRVVIALGISPPDVIARLREDADQVYCLLEPEPLGEVAYWFRNFEPVGDAEVHGALKAAAGPDAVRRTRHRQRMTGMHGLPAVSR